MEFAFKTGDKVRIRRLSNEPPTVNTDMEQFLGRDTEVASVIHREFGPCYHLVIDGSTWIWAEGWLSSPIDYHLRDLRWW